MVAALSAAARLGILIKNVGDIELAARINAFVFDKTGTLTTGKLAVSRLAPLDGDDPGRIAAPGRLRRKIQQPSRPPRRWRNWPAKRACRWPSRKILPKPPVAASSAQIDGAKIIVGRAQWLKDKASTRGFPQSPWI